jgi:hypothetical protein
MPISPKPDNATANVPPGWSGGDPTENVKALAAADSRRNDDLRHESERYLEARINALQREVEIRDACAKELKDAESRRVNEQAVLQANHAQELRDAEAKRIDAIRTVDVQAVGTASARADTQAGVLATNVASLAQTLRDQVAATALAGTATLQQAVNPILTRLTTLETSANQAAGKQAYSDPAFLELLGEVKQLRDANKQGVGKSEGINGTVAIIISIVLVGAAVVGVLLPLGLHH